VKRLLTWVAGAAGGLAAYRAATRHKAPEGAEVDPAAELRARLAEARTAEPDDAPPVEAPAGPDERRRSVQDDARSAIEEMRGDGS
jgi:hypothetical protein